MPVIIQILETFAAIVTGARTRLASAPIVERGSHAGHAAIGAIGAVILGVKRTAPLVNRFKASTFIGAALF